MRSLDEVLAELKAAEKEYAEKCAKYGIEEKHKKKKNIDVLLDENGNPIEQTEDVVTNSEEITQDSTDREANN